MINKKKQIPTSYCPYCNYKMDAVSVAAGESDATPKEGDVSVCFNCAGFLRFNHDLYLEKLPDLEMVNLKNNSPDLFNAIWNVKTQCIADIQHRDEG